MTTEEIVAYIGAAAWIPQIWTIIYRWLTKPEVTIALDSQAEIGFTPGGCCVNFRVALSASHKPVIIEQFSLSIKHQDGDERVMKWVGMVENFSEISDSSGKRQQTVSKDVSPIALKIGTESLIEKMLRFQEPSFRERDRPLVVALMAHQNYLRQADPQTVDQVILKSKEIYSLITERQKAFWWKAGKYEVTMSLRSPTALTVENPDFYFELTQVEIEMLKANVALIETDVMNIMSNATVPLSWSWATVSTKRPTPEYRGWT